MYGVLIGRKRGRNWCLYWTEQNMLWRDWSKQITSTLCRVPTEPDWKFVYCHFESVRYDTLWLVTNKSYWMIIGGRGDRPIYRMRICFVASIKSLTRLSFTNYDIRYPFEDDIVNWRWFVVIPIDKSWFGVDIWKTRLLGAKLWIICWVQNLSVFSGCIHVDLGNGRIRKPRCDIIYNISLFKVHFVAHYTRTGKIWRTPLKWRARTMDGLTGCHNCEQRPHHCPVRAVILIGISQFWSHFTTE